LQRKTPEVKLRNSFAINPLRGWSPGKPKVACIQAWRFAALRQLLSPAKPEFFAEQKMRPKKMKKCQNGAFFKRPISCSHGLISL
jgi:hypothetical protein